MKHRLSAQKNVRMDAFSSPRPTPHFFPEPQTFSTKKVGAAESSGVSVSHIKDSHICHNFKHHFAYVESRTLATYSVDIPRHFLSVNVLETGKASPEALLLGCVLDT